MSEDDYKSIIVSYQQKSFELFNQIIVLDAQISTLKNTINSLNSEIEELKNLKNTEEF